MPMAWALEFNRLPKKICMTIGTRTFSKKAKGYYFARCQHSESEIKFCQYCQKSTNNYQNDNMVAEYNRIVQNDKNFNKNANQNSNHCENQSRDQNDDQNQNVMEGLKVRLNDIKTGKVEGNIPSFLEKENAIPDIYYVKNNNEWVAEQIKLIKMIRYRMRMLARNRLI